MTNETKKPIACLADEVKAGLDYSRNFATAKPNIGSTEKEHILGLCNLLERLLAEHDQYCRMFNWAAYDLMRVGEALGIPGEEQEGGAAEFIEAIGQLRAVQQQAVPTGYALVPTRMQLDKEVIETLLFHVGGGDGDGEYVDGILWIGETTDDDGSKTYGLNIACAECPEEGSSTLVELDEVSPPLRHTEPQNIPESIPASPATQKQAASADTAVVDGRLEELKDVVHAFIVQYTQAGIEPEKDSLNPGSSLLYRAEQALGSDGSLVTALHDQNLLLQMELHRLKASQEKAALAAVPDEWKPVPIKPTIEMVEAGYEAALGEPDRSGSARVIDQYEAMLSAAPTPPAQQSQLYTCIGNGGCYDKIGAAKAAGATRDMLGDYSVIVYRGTETGQLYFRDPGDFQRRMKRIDDDTAVPEQAEQLTAIPASPA